MQVHKSIVVVLETVDVTKMDARVILYLFVVPAKQKKRVEMLSLFSTEYTWGLMLGGSSSTILDTTSSPCQCQGSRGWL